MNRILFTILMLLPMIVSAQNFNLSTENGTVSFTYDKGTKGTFGEVSAIVEFDVSDLSQGSISGSVDVSTLDTKNKMRNKHLKSDDFFDVENYPTMTFESTSISEKNGGFTIKGKLKIKTTEKEVTFKAINKDGKLVFTTTIYGLDYDVAASKKREKTKIEISVVIPM